MKRFLAILLCCVLLPVLALAENATVWTLWIGEDEEPAASVRLTEEDGQPVGLLSLFPDYAVIIPDEFRDLLFLREENLWDTCTQAAQAASDVALQWLQTLPAADAQGYYTGDAFDAAQIKKEYLLHSSDVVMLLTRLHDALEEEYPWLSRLAASLLERWMGSTNVPQEGILQIYNNGEDASLTLKRGEDVILTLSVRKNGGSDWLLVLGHAENGKTYYHRISAAVGEKSLDVNTILLADDRALGYRSLTDQAMVYREEISVYTEADGTLKLTHIFLPMDGQAGFMTTGTVNPSDPEQLCRLEAHYQGKKILILEAKKDEGEEQPENRNTLLLSELRRLENWPQLYGAAVTQLVNQLLKVIPIPLVLQFFMD